jgi:hypothetical protein
MLNQLGLKAQVPMNMENERLAEIKVVSASGGTFRVHIVRTARYGVFETVFQNLFLSEFPTESRKKYDRSNKDTKFFKNL